MSKLNINAIRNETPGCHVDSIFLSSAGSSLQPECVLNVIEEYMALEAVVGGYEAQTRYKEQFENVYDTIASYINCSRDEIALLENATRAWQSIFSSIPFEAGDIIVTSQSEYHSNFIPMLQLQERVGVEIKIVPFNSYGEVCVSTFEQTMCDKVKLVALTHIPSNNGLVNNAEEIGKIAKSYNALYLLDACQSVGQIPVNVEELSCDFLVASGRKFLRGPRGTGFLYAKQSVHENLVPAIMDGMAADWCNSCGYEVRGDARKYETWEKNIGLFLGLGAAVSYAQKIGQEAIWHNIQHLGNYARKLLREIPGVSVHDTGLVKCGIISFSIENHTPCAAYRAYASQGVYLGYTGVRSTRFDMEQRGLDCVLRASAHYFNTEEEIEKFAYITGGLVKNQSASVMHS